MKLLLNLHKPENYAFFCPVSRVHLTRSNPVAFVNEVTPAIERAIKSKTLVVVDEKAEQAESKPTAPVAEPKEETPVTKEEVKTEPEVTEETEKAEKTTRKRRGSSNS